MAGTGPVRNIRECPSCPEQSSREHPHRSSHLDHCCQVGGGKWQHSDGGQDHWQSHQFSTCQRCGDQQRAVDTGVFLWLGVFLTSEREREREKDREGFPVAVYVRGKLTTLNKLMNTLRSQEIFKLWKYKMFKLKEDIHFFLTTKVLYLKSNSTFWFDCIIVKCISNIQVLSYTICKWNIILDNVTVN